MKNFLHRRLVSERGIALVMTLAILVMVTMLVVAFAVSMRVESMGAKNFNTMIQARQLAQGAVDQAVGQIRSATPFQGIYVTMPGAIYWRNNLGNWTNVQLYTPYVATAGSNDMNAGNWITGSSGPQIFVGWSNQWVVVSGTTTQYSRYAYWVDDESTKVNVNTAGTRSSDPNGYTTAAVDLTVMFSSSKQQAITNFIVTSGRPFDTLDCIQQATNPTPILQPDESANQFYLTAVSSSPDRTPWGTKRLNLSSIGTNTPATAIGSIAAKLSESGMTNLFGFNRTFFTKYPSVQQIAANIFDYINTNNIPTDSGSWSDPTPPAYLGLKMTPYLNELVISNTIFITTNGVPSGQATMTLGSTTVFELWYMYPNNPWSAPVNTEIYFTNQPSLTLSNSATGVLTTNTLNPNNHGTISSVTASMTAGSNTEYSTFFVANSLASSTYAIASTSTIITVNLNANLLTAIYRVKNGYRIDYAQIPLANYSISLNLSNNALWTGPSHTISTNINWGTACNDPRVKPVNNNWNTLAAGFAGTLGQNNAPTLNRKVITTNGTAYICSDGYLAGQSDASCHTNIASVSQPRAMYASKMGFIHTGVPWRTFWIQPQPLMETNNVPDWAVLDLFSMTDSINVPGQINVNALPTNGATSFGTISSQPRFTPLQALLMNTGVSAALTNLYTGVPSVNAVFPGDFPNLSPNVSTFIGEICEILGVNSNAAAYKIDREAPIGPISNLITTRGNDFTIWAIAQSLQLIKTNAVPELFITNVTGEAKIQAIVERDDSSGSVKFRTRYLRYSTQ